MPFLGAVGIEQDPKRKIPRAPVIQRLFRIVSELLFQNYYFRIAISEFYELGMLVDSLVHVSRIFLSCDNLLVSEFPVEHG